MADDQLNAASASDAAPAVPGVAPQGTDQSQDWSATSTPSTPTDGTQIDNKGTDQNSDIQQGQQQTPDQTQAQFPFPGQSNPTQNAPQKQETPSAPQQQPYTPEQQAVVNKASWVHNVLQTISGGPQTKTVIDPNTGKSSQVVQPTSTKQLGLGLAIAALTGAFKGLGVANGPGNEGRAAAAGFGEELEQKQKVQEDQTKQASQDFARQAATTQANFQTRENNLRLANEDYNTQDKIMVQPSAALRDTARQNGDTIAQDVAPEDLLSQYHVTKDQAIPSKTVLVDDGNGGQRAKVLYDVLDPSKTGPMSQSIADAAAAFRIPGSYTTDANGKIVAKQFEGSAPVKYALQNQLTQATTSAMITQHLINSKLAELPDAPQVNIAKAFQDSTISTKALKAFSGYTGYDNIKEALDAFDKSKTNQDSGGVLGGQIRALFPGDTLQKIEKADADRISAEQGARETANKVNQEKALLPIEAQKEQLRANIASANAFRMGFNHEAGTQAAKVAAGVASGTLTGALKAGAAELNAIPAPPPTAPTVNGVNEAYLAQLKQTSPSIGAAVDAVIHGQAFTSNYGLAKDAGQMFLGYVHNASPTFSVADANRYEKQVGDFGINGKTGKANTAGSTLMEHLGRLYDSVGLASTVGASGKFKVDAANAVNEAGSFYANGNKPGEPELHDYRQAFNPSGNNPLAIHPGAVKDAIVEQATAAMDKIKENYNTQARSVPASFGKPQPILSQDAADSYKKLTGQNAPDYLIDHSVQSRFYNGQTSSTTAQGGGTHQPNAGQAARAPYAPPAGSFAGRDASGKIVQWKTPNGIVDANGQPVAAQ